MTEHANITGTSGNVVGEAVPVTQALLPCPFCGKQPAICADNSHGAAMVYCPNTNRCGVAPMSDADLTVESLTDAVERWNTRHATTARQQGIAEGMERAARIAEGRHEYWRMPHPDDAEPGEVCCDVTACADIATAIRQSRAGEGE